ncbi:MAG: flagellar basal body P-ring formation chaperone FlgA [Roseovarius sp.]
MRFIVLISALCVGGPVAADTVFAARTIRAQSILTAQDLILKNVNVPGAIADPSAIIGQEARVALYADRPIRLGDVGPPALVDRNQIVPLVFATDGLMITTEGRSMARAGVGEHIRVMNLSSRNTVMGLVMADGRVLVSR